MQCLVIACAIVTRRTVGGRIRSSIVDIYDVTDKSWSTAQLNEARSFLSATSMPNLGVVIFAGGRSESCYVVLGFFTVHICVRGLFEWSNV